MPAAFVDNICKHFEKVTDPRVNRGDNYPLVEMVFVALCGAICDCNSWVEVASFGECKLAWFRKFLPLEKGVPSHDTFTEVFARLDTIEFYAALESWARDVARSLRGETVAFDGKTLRGSFDEASNRSALHSVSAWACGLKMCLALKSVEDKSLPSCGCSPAGIEVHNACTSSAVIRPEATSDFPNRSTDKTTAPPPPLKIAGFIIAYLQAGATVRSEKNGVASPSPPANVYAQVTEQAEATALKAGTTIRTTFRRWLPVREPTMHAVGHRRTSAVFRLDDNNDLRHRGHGRRVVGIRLGF